MPEIQMPKMPKSEMPMNVPNQSSIGTDELELRLSLQHAIDDVPDWLSYEQLYDTFEQTVQCVAQQFDLGAEMLDVTLRVVDREEGQQLNAQYRHKDYPTNVLTFAYGVDETATLSADIVLCWPVVVAEAQQQHKAINDHARHLVVHGLLHALGFDHEEDEAAQEMEALEVIILAKFGVANPY